MMTMHKILSRLAVLLTVTAVILVTPPSGPLLLNNSFATYEEPVAIDSRIKTLIYTANQIFSIEANYGYQTFIEFGLKEKIKTIVVGDSVSWNINPVNNKLFLRPYQKSGKTNMTVITDQRTYVFDLVARSPEDDGLDRTLTYIVRFYYPDSEDEFSIIDKFREGAQEKNQKFSLQGHIYNTQYENLNHNYSISRANLKEENQDIAKNHKEEDLIKPIEVFDNSYVTFLKFRSSHLPQIFSINENGSETKLKMVQFEKYIVVNGVHKALRLRYKKSILTLSNNE